jgi:hypothetical protein
MASVETYTREIQSILQQQAAAPRPTAAVCAAIAAMKDLIELNASGSLDWRRGGGEGMRFRNGMHPSGSRGSLHSGNGQPETPMSRNSSTKSFESVHSPQSPGANGTPPPPVAKYQSRFKNSTQPVEEKILNNIILSKLNKFSPKTYDEIRDFLYQILGSGDAAELQEMVRDFMRLVFKKAAVEEMFCPLYAKLLCEISGRYKVILEEMHALQSNYLAIFDDVKEAGGSDYDAFVEQQKSKQFRVGYSQFLAELTGLEILNMDLLVSTFQRILANMLTFGKEEEKKTLLEEYSDCLVRMAKSIRKKPGQFFSRTRAALLAASSETLGELTGNSATYPSLSAKSRFILMDVLDILKGL